MALQPHKYWRDIIAPILQRDEPPTIPQAIVCHHDQVLLVKRDNPALWELPGGNMLPHETPDQTVVREVYEETGIATEIVQLLGWYERTGLRVHHSPVYLCRPTGGGLRVQAEETIAARYFPRTALPRSLFPWYRPILMQDMISSEPRPLRRMQYVGLQTLLHCIALDIGSRLMIVD